MSVKRLPSGKSRSETRESPALGEVMAELYAPPTPPAPAAPPSSAAKMMRARRAGPFKVPVRLAGPPNTERASLAMRFKQHLRGISGASKLASDPDEFVPTVRARPQSMRPGPMRPGFGARPRPAFGRPPVINSDDEEDE